MEWVISLLFLTARAEVIMEEQMCKYEPMCLYLPDLTTNSSKLAVPAECECIRYIRETFNVNVRGDASALVPNITLLNAQKGDIVLLNYAGVVHGAYIQEIRAEGILVYESNFVKCTPTTRLIPYDSPFIGFYRSTNL